MDFQLVNDTDNPNRFWLRTKDETALYCVVKPKKRLRHYNCNRNAEGGYYVDTVGRNKKQIAEYIKHQLDEDQIADQMSLKEFIDPFTGSKNTKA